MWVQEQIGTAGEHLSDAAVLLVATRLTFHRLASMNRRADKQTRDGTFLQEFVDFVRREDPDVLPATAAIVATGTLGDAADWLGIGGGDFGRTHERLRQLARCFQNGKPVPRRRRSYRKRIVKTRILQTCSEHATERQQQSESQIVAQLVRGEHRGTQANSTAFRMTAAE